MARIELSIDARKVLRTVHRAPERLKVNMRKALQTSGQEFQRAMRESFGGGGDRLRSRTGLLKRSIFYEVSGTELSDLALRVGSAGVKYANLQEFGTAGLPGGVIRPKKPGGWLTIPIDDNLTPAGAPIRPSARDVLRNKNAFFLKTKSGRLYIAEYDGSGRGQLRFLFKLVKQVRVPPRLGLRATWNRLRPNRVERAVAAAQKSLEEAARAG